MKCGTVAIIGRPNVGKSSLINALLKAHAVIISPKPQTTRNSIRCIYNDDRSQIIFTDTPGLYKVSNERDRLGIFLNDEILESVNNSDVVLWLIEGAYRKLQPEDYEIAKLLPDSKPVILAANKSDLTNTSRVLNLFDGIYNFRARIQISARTKRGLDELLTTILDLLPEGEPVYDPEILMDTTEKFMAAEIVREKILMLLRDEVPHSVAVDIEEYKSPEEFAERSHRKLYIRALLITETEGQKKIVIGEGGRMIKKIGAMSRESIEEATGLPVYLDLWVKVVPGWRRNNVALRRLGYYLLKG